MRPHAALSWLALPLLLTACKSSEEPQLVARTADLPHTRLAAGWGAPLAPGDNLLWCASLPLAWYELEGLLGGKPRSKETPPELALLESTKFDRADLDPASVTTSITVDRSDPEPRIRVVTLLEKALSFAVAFEDLPGFALAFHSPGQTPQTVDAFGIGRFDPSDDKHQRMKDQLEVLHYASRADFVVRLLGEGDTDRLYLARLAPGPTLDATWEAVAERLASGEGQPLRAGDSFLAPELDFDLQHVFEGLIGLRLENPGFEGAWLDRAQQSLRLRLDEKGMVLRSRVEFGVASAAPAPDPRQLVLDGPFLVAAIEANAASPYLLAWIGHPELLLAADGER